MEYKLALAGLVLVILTFLAMVESAHGCLSDVALRSLAAEPLISARVRFLRFLLEHRQLFWLSLSFGLQCAIIVLAMILADVALQFQAIGALALAFVGTMVLVMLFRQVLPRLMVQHSPGPYLMRLLPAYQVYFRLTSPLIVPLYHLIKMFRQSAEFSMTPESFQLKNMPALPTDDTIQALIDVGEEEGIIEESDSQLIQSIIEFGDTVVKQVMTHRTEMVCLESTATITQARDLMIAGRHSRLPVYRDKADNIEGVIYVRDLLACWSESRMDEPVGTIARPAYFVPENKSVADLLEEMQKSKTQIALVIDEFGGVAGLVTIEDILEEIVGEIEDEDVEETSPEEMEIVEETDGVHLVKGNTEIRKVELLFDMELERDDFTTVNGFITNTLGRVPTVGEQFVLRGLLVEVLEADGRAIRRVRLSVAPESPSTPPTVENEALKTIPNTDEH